MTERSAPAGAPAAPGTLRLDTGPGRWVLFAAVLGSSLAMIDATVVNVALPAIGREFDSGLAGLQWTVNAYTLTLAAFILLGGSLGDHFGRRRVFVVGVVWFAAASVVCALSTSVEVLVAGRFLQGIGGALLTPGSLAMISASFRPEDRGRAIGAWSGLGGVAAAIGPFLGGWLVEVDWHLIFWINVPLAAVTVAVAVRHVPESRDPSMATGGGLRALDPVGAVLAVIGLAGVTAALIETGTPGAPFYAVAGVVALIGFVVVERRGRYPMVPPSIFASREFTGANVATLAIYGALGGVLFILVLQLQVVSGFSALAAGTSLLPMTVLMLLLSSRAGDLAQRIGPRLPMTLGPLVCAAGVLLLLRIGPDASYLADVLPAVVVFGLGLSLTVAPLTTTVLAAAPAEHAGVASGVNNAVARAASLIAVAVLPLVAGLGGQDYQDPAAFDDAFRRGVLFCAALLAVGAAIAWLTVRSAGTARPVDGTDDQDAGGRAARDPEHRDPHDCSHCGIDAPPLAARRREPAGQRE